MPESLVYYRPDSGAGLELNDGVNFKMIQHEGFGIGPMAHFAAATPELHGEYWYGMRLNVKVITIDLLIYASSLTDLQNKRRQLVQHLNPTLVNNDLNKLGKLRLTQTNGLAVQMDCILSEEMLLPTSQHIAQRAARYQLRFRSLRDPVLYDPVTQSIVYTVSATTGFRVPWRLPLRLSSGGIFQRPTLDPGSDVWTPVLIDIQGPALSPIVKNVTANRTIAFQSSANPLIMGAGQHLVINSDPNIQTITLDGVSTMQRVSTEEFWGLDTGNNELYFDIGGAGVGTQVTMSWNPRLLGA